MGIGFYVQRGWLWLQFLYPTSLSCEYSVIRKEQKIADFRGAGKDFGMEKYGVKKSWKNREKSSIFCRFFRKWPIFADFSACDLQVPGRCVRAAFFVDLSVRN